MPVKRQDIGGRNAISFREDCQLRFVVWIGINRCPLNLNRIVGDIVHMEFAGMEYGRKHRAGKCSSTRDGFVPVKCKGQRFSCKGLLNFQADGRDTCRAADEFDRVELLEGETAVRDDPVDDGFRSRTSDSSWSRVRRELASISFVMDSTESGDSELADRTFLGFSQRAEGRNVALELESTYVYFVFRLELCGKVSEEGAIYVSSAQIAVICVGCLDGLRSRRKW